MKKRKLTILCFAATTYLPFSAHAQNSVTLYGLIDTGVAYVSNGRTNPSSNMRGGSMWSETTGNINTSRWGVRGTEGLGNGLSAIFRLESGLNSANGQLRNGGDIFGRQAWLGLDMQQYGKVTLGRQYDFVVDYLAPLSATGSGFAANLAEHPYDNDNLNNDLRLNNSIKFASRPFDGVSVGAAYGFSNKAGAFANNRAYSVGTRYSNGALNFAVAYFQLDRTAAPREANATGAVSTDDGDEITTGGTQRILGAGAQYVFDKSSVGLVYTHSVTDDVTGVLQGGSTSIGALSGKSISFDNLEINGRYFLRPDFSLGASYVYTMGSFVSLDDETTSPHWNQLMVQGDYRVSKRTDVYAEGVYQHVSGGHGNPAFNAGIFNLSPATGNHQFALALGIRHLF